MKKETDQSPKKQLPLLSYIIIFICGFVAGIFFATMKMGPTEQSGQQPGVAANQTNTAITNMEAEVTANPENFQAWVQLGHLYFDSDQNDKAIAAYTTSLKYHSGDANLLTDLGVMYRRTKQPQKAIESFDKARSMDPTHQQSRFNKGIVLYYDLKDLPGAIATWEELLTINPDAQSGNGQKIRDFVDQIKAELNKE